MNIKPECRGKATYFFNMVHCILQAAPVLDASFASPGNKELEDKAADRLHDFEDELDRAYEAAAIDEKDWHQLNNLFADVWNSFVDEKKKESREALNKLDRTTIDLGLEIFARCECPKE